MASTVKDIDTGWKKFKKTLSNLGKKEVVVGIPGEVNFSGPSMAAIGAVHEFGSNDGSTPSRSFLRSTFDEEEAKYEKLLESHVKSSLRDRKVRDASLSKVGKAVQKDVVDRIRGREIPQGLADPNDDIALIDTGDLVESIVTEIRRRQ